MPALVLLPAGMIFGSFLGVVAHRLPRGESFVTGRSHCPGCGVQIHARDNVPVLSWLWLRGRCRGCGERIPARYPLAELGLGVLWLTTYLVLADESTWEIVAGLVLGAVLVAITLTDLERRVIPNPIVIAGALAGVAIVGVGDASALPDRLIAGTAAGGMLLLVALAHPRGMGMGDVKLAAMMGIYLGRGVAPAMLIGFAAGALVGIAMIARHGKVARKRAVPFGPFLALGGVVGLWYGDAIVDWYVDSFLSS